MINKISYELMLYNHISLCGLKKPIQQYKIEKPESGWFTKKERSMPWKCDLAWPQERLIVEVEGGVYINGRHQRPIGFTKDCIKYNSIVLMGWKLLRVTPEHIENGRALDWIEKFLKDYERTLYRMELEKRDNSIYHVINN